MARTLDIYCKVCNSKATVTRTERIHSEYSKSYCTYKNPACGHKFVLNVEFSHTTKTSLLTKDGLLSLMINQLSDKDKQKIREMLNQEEKGV
ncbi:TPA: ogr/Delta-like zinc finger family protein [Pasteurella multocida]